MMLIRPTTRYIVVDGYVMLEGPSVEIRGVDGLWHTLNLSRRKFNYYTENFDAKYYFYASKRELFGLYATVKAVAMHVIWIDRR